MNDETQVVPNLPKLSISEIASKIYKDWAKVYFGAKPYLEAMRSLHSIDDAYYADTGRSVVLYFLSNAQTWRGPVARAIKEELNRRLKEKKA